MPPLLPPSSELSACPELSVCPELFACPEMTTEVVPLSATLPVLGVAMWCVWVAHTILEPFTCLDFPPSLPLPPPLYQSSQSPPLSPGSPSAHPQPTICAVGSLQVCQSPSASWLEGPLSLPPASESRNPPWPFDPAAPPWNLAPSSPPWPVSPPVLLGSLVPPAPTWSVVDHPLPWDYTLPATPHPSVRLLLPSGSTLVLCRSNSIDEPSPSGATVLRIAPEPEPNTSDQMREPATDLATGESVMDSDSAEGSSAHCTMAEGEPSSVDCYLDIYADMPPLLPPSSELSACPELSVCPELFACPEMTTEVVPLSATLPVLGVAMWCVWVAHTILEPFTCLDFPPSLPLPPPLYQSSQLPPLSPGSPSAHPQPTICAVGSLQVCQSPSASWLEGPLSLPPASESRNPPWPFDPAAPPWNLAPSSPPWPVSPPVLLGSLVPPAPTWSVVDHPLPWDYTLPATPHPSVRLLLPSGSTLVLCRSNSTAAFRIPASASVARAICSALALWILPVALAHRLSVSAPGSTTTCSAIVGRPLGVGSPSSTMAPPSVGSTVGGHHGCGLGPTLLLLLQVPPVLFLAPPSDPPWLLLSLSWLLPLSFPPWILLVILLPDVHPPLEPLSVLSDCLPASPLPSPVTIPSPLFVSYS